MKPLTLFSYRMIFLAGLLSAVLACDKDRGRIIEIKPGPNAETETQDALNTVEPGWTIVFEEGIYEFSRTLTMDEKSEVRIKGMGREKTILSFSDQMSGGNALLISGSENIVVRDLTIRDAAGDALKIQNSNGIVMHRLATVWSGEPSEENGAYGLYPVLSSNILIDECYAYGASDAGIYVGQSDKAIVRNSTVEGNVSGIQIENTTNADVYGNVASDNTGGILVFDLPGLSQSGARTRVFDNTVVNNGRGNFASGGSIVAEVPAGTGILVMSTDEVEIFDNLIEGNNVVGTGVFSYNSMIALGLVPPPFDAAYNPGKIYIHDNMYSRENSYVPAEDQSFFGNMLVDIFGSNPIPNLITDGFFVPGADASGSICIEKNSGETFVNLNIPNDFPNNLSFDVSPHNCSMAALPAVELNIPKF